MKTNILYAILMAFFVVTLNAQVKQDSLLLHYPFNGNANDLSGNLFNGQNFGAANDSDRFDAIGNAFYFDGINNYVSVPSDSLLRPDFPFSVSLWVKIDQLNANHITLYSSCEVANVYSGFNIKYSPTGYITVQYGNGQGTAGPNRRGRIAYTQLNVGEWHHVAVSFNGLNDIRIYIDGLDKSGAYSGSASSMVYTTQPGAIGKNITPSGTYYHKGSIDQVRLYNDSLSLTDAQFLFYESPCEALIEVIDTILVIDTVAIMDTIVVNDTTNTIIYTSSTDTMFIDLPQNPESIKVYANPNKTKLNINIGANLPTMLGYSMNVTNKFGQQVFYTQINASAYQLDLLTIGYLGLHHLNILNNQGVLIESRKLMLY